MPPKIHKSLDSLKPKLKQYEPHIIQRRIGLNATIVFSVRYLKFNPKIPILDEDTFKPEEESGSVESKVIEKKVIGIDVSESDIVECESVQSQVVENGFGESKFAESEIAEKEIVENRVEKEQAEDESAESESLDRLVVTGPEEDEFRQYDDNDEDESVISRNLKKIRSDPQPQKAPVKTSHQNQSAPLRVPQQNQSTTLKTHLNLPVQKETQQQQNQSISKVTPNQDAPKQQELTIADINKLLEQKNLRLVHAELNRRKETLKYDEAARLTLKKAVFSCLERDETFTLLKLINLVFEFNYSSDTQFWDELIGKLKRKDNPHAKCHLFKCETDPVLVLHNYHLTTQHIVEYFDATNPSLALPWRINRYLIEASQRLSKPNASLTVPIVTNSAVLNPQAKYVETMTKLKSQENLDPTEERRDVSFFKDTDGEHKFKITIPKREAKFNPKLLIT